MWGGGFSAFRALREKRRFFLFQGGGSPGAPCHHTGIKIMVHCLERYMQYLVSMFLIKTALFGSIESVSECGG